jgi:hypothetical protein
VGSPRTPNQIRSLKVSKPVIEPLVESIKLPQTRIAPQAASQQERPQRPRKVSGAMAQQSGASGWDNQSAPQKLLHLVGCREQKPADATSSGKARARRSRIRNFAISE